MSIVSTKLPNMRSRLSHWRLVGTGVLRIVFGIVMAVDAYFEWQSDFVNNFMSYFNKAVDGQAPIVSSTGSGPNMIVACETFAR